MSSNLVVSVLQLVTCAVIGVGFLCGISAARDHNQVENAADDSVTYRMVEHPESGATLPRVHLEERPDAQRRVNRTLDSMAAEFQCSESRIERLIEKYDYMERGDFEYNSDAEVTYSSERIFSIAIRIDGYCGGPNPWYDFDPLTFDLRSGERLRLSELFVDFQEKQTEIFNLFVSEIRSARQNQLEESGAAPSEDPCLQHEIVLERPWEPHSFDFVFVEDGLKVEADLASPRCEVGAVIAYERLQKFASAESALQSAIRGE